jgi:hypothetical protein
MAKRRATIVKERNESAAGQDKIDTCLEGLYIAYKAKRLEHRAYCNLLKMGLNAGGVRFITAAAVTLKSVGAW